MFLRSFTLTPERFGVLYEHYSVDMLAYFTRRTHDPEVALDLVSETFVEAFDDRDQFRGKNLEQARAWIWTVARRQLADYWRHGKVERRALTRVGIIVPRELTDEEYERIEDLAGLKDLCEMVRDGMEGLPEEHRAAVHLRVVEEQSYDEIADSLRITPQNARARVSRGLRALAEQLEELQGRERTT